MSEPKYAIGEYVRPMQSNLGWNTGIVVDYPTRAANDTSEHEYVVKDIEFENTHIMSESEIEAHDDQPGLRVTRDNQRELSGTTDEQVIINGELYELDGYGEELSNGSRWAVLRRAE